MDPAVGPSEKVKSMKIDNPSYNQTSVSIHNTQNTTVGTKQLGSVYADTGVSSVGRDNDSAQKRQVDFSATEVSYQNYGETRSGEEENPYDVLPGVLPSGIISKASDYTSLADSGTYYQL